MAKRVAGAKKGKSGTAARQVKANTKKGSIKASTKAFNSFLAKEKKAGRTVSAAARTRILRDLQAAERRVDKKKAQSKRKR